MSFNNPYNYIRVSELQPVSIESLAILVAVTYLLYLAYRRELSLEIAYFLALPFSDDPFRIASSVQPVEVLAMILVAANYRKIRLNYVILMGLVFLLFSVIGYLTGNVTGLYSFLYSLRFLMTGMTFSILLKSDFALPISVMRFAVAFTFAMTFLQLFLWLAGLPIHGVFYAGIFPRTKGLAHEPGTWAIWIVALFPFIYHFKLGRLFLWLNIASLLMTLSTFGFLVTLSFLLIRWSIQGFQIRLKKSAVRIAGVSLGIAMLLVIVQPGLLGSAGNLLASMDKFVYYQQEFTHFATGQSAVDGPNGDASGRGRDFTYFQKYFPKYWLVGNGSWNTDPNLDGATTNLYVYLPVEIGVTGYALMAVLFFLHFRTLLRNRERKSAAFWAGSLNFLLMIAGIRCFAFHELWYVQANTLRLPRDDEPIPEIATAQAAEPAEPAATKA